MNKTTSSPQPDNLYLLAIIGTLGANRTRDTRIRNPVLYPLSYEGNMNCFDNAQ